LEWEVEERYKRVRERYRESLRRVRDTCGRFGGKYNGKSKEDKGITGKEASRKRVSGGNTGRSRMGEPGRHRRNCERCRMGDPMETQGELWEIDGFGMGNRREI
jgi:hypothetical protein